MFLKRNATVMLSAALLAASTLVSPAAQAANLVSQLPGASAEGTVVVTDSPHVTVNVAPVNTEATVDVEIVNNYDHTFECYAPGVSTDEAKPAKLPNVVTEASIVKDSVNYYRAQPFLPKDGKAVPVVGVIPTDGFLQFVPQGSAGKLFGADTAARSQLFRAWDRAHIAGHTAEIAPFTLGPRATEKRTVTLNTPGHGERTNFDAAALLYCTDVDASPNQAYVFAGYEPGVNPMWSGLSSVAKPVVTPPANENDK